MRLFGVTAAGALPFFLLPFTGDLKDESKHINQAREISAQVQSWTPASKLPHLATLDALPLISAAHPRVITDTNYQITDVITDPKKMSNKFDAYYKVDTNNEGWFYIARYKHVRNNKIFVASFDVNQKKNGLVFPKSENPNMPVALIDAEPAGLQGVFKIYDTGNGYSVDYDFSPMMLLPSHTHVSANYMVNMENSIRKLPDPFTKELAKQGIKVLIGKNPDDVYYHYYPQWKIRDQWKVEDINLPPYEKTENGYIDHRKYSSIGGLYIDKKAIIPETYRKYGTNTMLDRSKSIANIMFVLSHELGHGTDYAYGARLSDVKGFKIAHAHDVAKFSEKDKKSLVYFYNSRSEAFAHLTAAMLGGLSKKESAIMLDKFSKSAEHIRQLVLPRFGVELSVDDIRRDIYPNYLQDQKARKEDTETTSVLEIPDMPTFQAV